LTINTRGSDKVKAEPDRVRVRGIGRGRMIGGRRPQGVSIGKEKIDKVKRA
jgi:hypothetical protein